MLPINFWQKWLCTFFFVLLKNHESNGFSMFLMVCLDSWDIDWISSKLKIRFVQAQLTRGRDPDPSFESSGSSRIRTALTILMRFDDLLTVVALPKWTSNCVTVKSLFLQVYESFFAASAAFYYISRSKHKHDKIRPELRSCESETLITPSFRR